MNEFCGAFFDKVDKSGPVLPMIWCFWKHLQKYWEPLDFGGFLIPPPWLLDGLLCWEPYSVSRATLSDEVGCTTSKTDIFTYWFKKSPPDCTENPGHNSIQTGDSLAFKPYLWLRWVFVTPTYLPALLQNLFWKWRQWRDKFKLTVFVFAAFTIVIFACVHSLSRKTWNIRKPCAHMSIPAKSSKLKAALSCKSRGLQVLLCFLHLMFCKVSGSR